MSIVSFSPAEWIWAADNTAKDQKAVFRRKIFLPAVPKTAWAFIACDTKFWLWINGEMVVFEGGVFRESRPGCGYAERVDMVPYLKMGENVIAALVWFYGNGGRNSTNSGEAGFIIKCDEIGLYSSSDFLVANHPAYVPTKPPHSSHLYGGENIGFNADLDFGDFTALEFDEASFSRATEYPNRVWGDCVVSELPQLKVYPQKDVLFHCTEYGATARLPYAMAMSVAFELDAQGGEIVDVRTDRYTVNGGPGDERRTYNGHRIEYRCKAGVNQFKSLMYLYGEELRLSFPGTVKLKTLSYEESGYHTKRIGVFRTEDTVFNRLIEKSIRTLYVCMRNNFMDCPDRERGQWIGDVSVQAPQVFFAFDGAAQKLLKKAICDFIYLRKGDALVGNVPGENAMELPGQSLIAISEFGLIGEYYHYSHDSEIPDMVLLPIVNYLKLWEMDGAGLLAPRGGRWRWFDHLYNVDEPVLENCLYISAAKYALKLAALSGNHDLDGFLQERITTLTESIERQFWNGAYYTSGGYADDRANAIAVLSGVCPRERYDQMKKIMLSVFNATPYFERFVLLALCEMGYVQDAYRRMMSRYYNLAMNENSTLWEDFYILGTKNHAWSGCPLEIAFKYILGLKTDDAFATYSISPVPGIFREIHCTFPAGGKTIDKSIVFQDNDANMI